ncbi:MAG TPA: ABC transporter permease, partial [Candidatus Acidoferrum sp.]|nr:ABC transporter permease [Candidatus Acidoferrum sp.]
MAGFIDDLREAVGWSRRSPGLALVAVATLGTGIGASTAVFGVASAALVPSLPCRDADRLVAVASTDLGAGTALMNTPATAHRALRAAGAFDGIFVYRPDHLEVALPGGTAAADTLFASADLFRVLGARPALGRAFDAEAERAGARRVVLIGDRLWRTGFGANPAVVGGTLRVGGEARVILGVLPAGFRFPGSEAQIVAPLAFDPPPGDDAGAEHAGVIARLADGVDLERAVAELDEIGTRVEAEEPWTERIGVTAVPLADALAGEARPPPLLVFGAVGLVLLIACASLASLALARAAAGPVTAVALGRQRPIRRLLAESALLALGGGGAGLLLACWFEDLLAELAGDALAGAAPSLDPIALLLATGVSAAAILALRAMPGLRATRGDSARRTAGLVVVARVALSVILLAGGG